MSSAKENANRKKAGLVHIYCGDGKGKTTAGMGLCARAAGAGKRVLICQFMKDHTSAERRVLEALPNVTFANGQDRVKFSFRMTEAERAQQKVFYDRQFAEVTRMAIEEAYDVLFLDEVLYCIRAGLMEEAPVVRFLEKKPAGLEVILTGQGPGKALIDLADYVSEIRKVKHPFDVGVPAREGIER